MFTSNINEHMLKAKLQDQDKNQNYSSDFLQNVKTNLDLNKNTTRTNEFTYENIKGITSEEIESLFTNEADKNMAKNLKLATDFTQDPILGKALFDTVLGKPFDLGYSYLLNTYEDKHNFLLSKNNNSSIADLLSKAVSSNYSNTDKKITDKVPQEYLDEILLEIDSFSFLDAMNSGYKDAYGNYEKNDYYDDEPDYSFLYNDFALQYEQLKIKYEDSINTNKNIIKQY